MIYSVSLIFEIYYVSLIFIIYYVSYAYNFSGKPLGYNSLICGIAILYLVNEFKLQLNYYVHFQTYTFEEKYEPLIPSLAIGKIVPLLFFYQDFFDFK